MPGATSVRQSAHAPFVLNKLRGFGACGGSWLIEQELRVQRVRKISLTSLCFVLQVCTLLCNNLPVQFAFDSCALAKQLILPFHAANTVCLRDKDAQLHNLPLCSKITLTFCLRIFSSLALSELANYLSPCWEATDRVCRPRWENWCSHLGQMMKHS